MTTDDVPAPVDLVAPDISPWRESNTGVPYVIELDSGVAGPDAMVNAVTHGNEICGAIAVDWLLRSGFHPTKGKLTLAFVNTAAFLAFDPASPGASRFVDEDMNRLWTHEQLDTRADSSTELSRARELRPFYDRVTQLLDIHSMSSNHGPIMLCHGDHRQRVLAAQIGVPIHVGCGGGFVGEDKCRLIEYAPLQDSSHKCAVLVECGQHWAAESATVGKEALLNWLRVLGMVSPEFFSQHAAPVASHPQQIFLEITDGYAAQSDGEFEMVSNFAGLDKLSRKGTLLATDGDHPPLLTPYDDTYLVMPPMKGGQIPKGGRTVRMARAVATPTAATTTAREVVAIRGAAKL